MTEASHYDYAIDPQGNSTANKILKWIGHDQRVLELGTAAGVMTRAIKAQGCTVTGIEFMPSMAELAAPDCERMIISDLDNLEFSTTFGDTQFDVLVAADVLEHLRDPWHLLEQARSIIAPCGHAVFSIPNIGHAAVVAGLLNGHFDYCEKGLLDRTHLRFFTRKGIEDMLLTTGWLPIAWESHRVAPLDSEFAHHWQAQPEEQRLTISQHPDSDIYQFIVKAVPASETGWQQRLQAQIQALTDKAQATQRTLEQTQSELEQTLDRLREHQQAFEEAKAWIANLQQEVASCKHESDQLQTTLEQTQAILEQTKTTLEHEATELQQRMELEIARTHAELSRFKRGLIPALSASIGDWLARKKHRNTHRAQS